MMLRRYHQGAPSDTASDDQPPASDTESDTPNAPSDTKPSGRSSARKKPKGE